MAPPTTYLRKRTRLAKRLKELRDAADVSGNQLAKRLRWAQSKVSRIETAKQLPTAKDIRAWARVLGAPAETVEELLSLLHGLEEYATHRADFRAAGGAAGKQADVAVLEAQSTRIREFQPAMIPGLLQTGEYASHLLRLPSGPSAWGASDEDIDKMVATRLRRQREALHSPGKRVEMVLLEAALLIRSVPADVLVGQLDRLLVIMRLPTVDIGVISFSADVPIAILGGFAAFDDVLVVEETLAGEEQFSDPDEVALYDRLFAQLMDAAAHGEQAIQIVQRALATLQV